MGLHGPSGQETPGVRASPSTSTSGSQSAGGLEPTAEGWHLNGVALVGARKGVVIVLLLNVKKADGG